MMEKILKQTGLCLLVVLALFLANQSNVPILERGVDIVKTHMEVNYTLEDVTKTVRQGKAAAETFSTTVEDTVGKLMGQTSYGEPIDTRYTGTQAAVYAVAGGQVTAVGENEEIGKYVKILHGNGAESLYGNLKAVHVSVPVSVKKGQLIGIYEKREGKDFYYSLNEFE